MKFDKDTLIKQRFWVMLGVSAPLSLVALLVLLTAVGANISKQREELTKQLKTVKDAANGDQKNDAWIEKKAEEAKKAKDREALVWGKAYERQKALYTWPESMENKFQFTNGFFATDIVADRKGEAPTEAPKDEEGRLFHGTVAAKEKDWILVQGKDQQRKFFRTVNGTVTVNPDAKKVFFHNIELKDRVSVTYEMGKFFNDPLTDSEQTEYTRSYHSQLDGILRIVDPMDLKGNGAVQLKGWFYKENWVNKKEDWPKMVRFFSYVADDWKAADDISEEAWLAQEDLWVQRELYSLIRKANDYVSKCQGTGGEEKNKWYKFKNPYWELDLLYPGGKNLEVKIKNLLDRRQKLDLSFRMRFNKRLPAEIVTIGGEPLDPRGTKNDTMTKTIPLLDGMTRTGIYEVEQVLTWETAAVKRIDHLSIGNISGEDCAHSNRTFPEGTRPLKKEEKTDTTTSTDTSKGPPGYQGSNMPGGPTLPGGPGMPGMMGGADSAKRTVNGLIRDRYLDVTAQARRIPVGLVLIVDQYHVDHVQLAFCNSNLRFLTTQVILNRYPQSMRPNLQQPESMMTMPGGPDGGKMMYPGSAAPPAMPPMPMGGSFGPMPMVPGGSLDPFGMNLNAPADDQESNIEMVIYGILTLYERYPPRATSPAAVPSN